MLTWQQFCWGFVGSMALEIIDANDAFHATPIQIPSRYCRVGYWFVRFALALVCGAFAVISYAPSPILALEAGAIAPLLIRASSVGRHHAPDGSNN